MLRKPLFWDLFGLICCIALIHIIAAQFYIYWTVPLFDIPMHFLGGFWVGLSSLWIYYIGEYITPFKKNARAMFFAVIMTVLTIGLGWEVFELVGGITGISKLEKLDLVKDIGVDLIGAISAYLYFKYRIKDLNIYKND